MGFGLRIGRNADAQFLFEFGPQTNTQELGNNGISKKRHTYVDSKKYSNDRGLRQFLNKTVFNNKKQSQKKFTRGTPEVWFRNNFTESTTETELTTVVIGSSMAMTTRLPVTEVLPETTSPETASVTKTPNQLYSSKYVEDDTLDTNNIVEKYNKKQPMYSDDVFRLMKSLMNILPVP